MIFIAELVQSVKRRATTLRSEFDSLKGQDNLSFSTAFRWVLVPKKSCQFPIIFFKFLHHVVYNIDLLGAKAKRRNINTYKTKIWTILPFYTTCIFNGLSSEGKKLIERIITERQGQKDEEKTLISRAYHKLNCDTYISVARQRQGKRVSMDTSSKQCFPIGPPEGPLEVPVQLLDKETRIQLLGRAPIEGRLHYLKKLFCWITDYIAD